MISIYVELFNRIAPLLRQQFKGISVYPEYLNAPAKFPHVSIVEADNYTQQSSVGLLNNEVAVNLLYEINVYSNKQNGKKQEADKIMNVIDDQMQDMGFIRTSKIPIANIENATIYRIVARYTKLQTR